MTDRDFELIYSPLMRTHSAEGHTLQIQIYRSADSPWILEIQDELGTSTVWDESFETDTAALEAAFLAIEEEGTHNFVTTAQREAKGAEPELMRKLAQAQRKPPVTGAIDMTEPLSDEELDELDDLLLEVDAEQGMTLDTLDGLLHALAIGPETVMPSQWLPKVWGLEDGGMMPPMSSPEQVNHLLGLIMRHHNSIIAGLAHSPPLFAPLWSTRHHDRLGHYEDAEMWATGFAEGKALCEAAWHPMFKHPDGQQWYRPIHLLGESDASPEGIDLIRTPEQRAKLTAQIEHSVLQMNAYWLPLRGAMAERQTARAVSTKVGRNEPCPCGSGKKFKKCCGAPSERH